MSLGDICTYRNVEAPDDGRPSTYKVLIRITMYPKQHNGRNRLHIRISSGTHKVAFPRRVCTQFWVFSGVIEAHYWAGHCIGQRWISDSLIDPWNWLHLHLVKVLSRDRTIERDQDRVSAVTSVSAWGFSFKATWLLQLGGQAVYPWPWISISRLKSSSAHYLKMS